MEPITAALAAIAAVKKTVEVIKQARSAVDDVASLGPMLGTYFGNKSKAAQALQEAKEAGGSNLAQAIQLEMELLSQKQFEEELKMLFFQSGHADIWQNIQKRIAESERELREAQRREREAAIQRKKKLKQRIEVAIGVVLGLSFIPVVIWAIIELAILIRDMKGI